MLGDFGQWWDRKELFLKRPPTPVEDGNAEDGGKDREHADGHAQAGKKGKGKGLLSLQLAYVFSVDHI